MEINEDIKRVSILVFLGVCLRSFCLVYDGEWVVISCYWDFNFRSLGVIFE